MQKIYLRVQHDVRTGPFTLEEILQFHFTTEDLIWVIGQSEDWLPVMETPSLKPYFVQEDEKILAKKDALKSVQIQVVESISNKSTSSIPYGNAGLLDKQLYKDSIEEETATGAVKDPEIEKKRQSKLDSFFNNHGKKAFTSNDDKKTERVGLEEDEDDTENIFKNKKALIGAGALILAFLVGNSFLANNNKNSRPKPSYSMETAIQTTPSSTFSVANQIEPGSQENESVNSLATVAEVSEPISEQPLEQKSQVSTSSVDEYIDSLRAVSSDREPGLTKADYARVKPSPYLIEVLKRRQEAKKHEKITTMKDLREASARKVIYNKNLPSEARTISKSRYVSQK